MKKILNPNFLQTLDQKLVQNHPLWWQLRIHYAAYHGLLLLAASVFIALILPLKIEDDFTHTSFTGITILFATFAFCYWVYKYMLFNKHKQFGLAYWKETYLTLIGTLVITFIFILPVFTFNDILLYRISNLIEDGQLTKEIDIYNRGVIYVPSSSNNFMHSERVYNGETTSEQEDTIYFDVLSSYSSLPSYGLNCLPDSMLTQEFYKYKNNKLEIEKRVGAFTSLVANYTDVKAPTAMELCQQWMEMKACSCLKYEHKQFEIATNETYRILRRIASEKSDSPILSLKRDVKDVWAFIGYFLLIISVLLNLYKNSHWRQFILAVVIGFLLPIVVMILGFILLNGDSVESLFNLLPLLYISLIIVSIDIKHAKAFHWFKAQSLIIVTYLMPFILPMLFSYYFHDHPYFYDWELNLENKMERNYNWELFQQWVAGICWASIGIYIIFLPWLNKRFQHLWALPK